MVKLTKEEARDIIFEDNPDWEAVTEEEIVGRSRWSVQYSRVFKFEGKFYRFDWRTGATEQQDEGAYEYDDFVEPTEVIPKTVEVIQYVKA